MNTREIFCGVYRYPAVDLVRGTRRHTMTDVFSLPRARMSTAGMRQTALRNGHGLYRADMNLVTAEQRLQTARSLSVTGMVSTTTALMRRPRSCSGHSQKPTQVRGKPHTHREHRHT